MLLQSCWVWPGISTFFPGISAQKNRHIFMQSGVRSAQKVRNTNIDHTSQKQPFPCPSQEIRPIRLEILQKDRNLCPFEKPGIHDKNWEKRRKLHKAWAKSNINWAGSELGQWMRMNRYRGWNRFDPKKATFAPAPNSYATCILTPYVPRMSPIGCRLGLHFFPSCRAKIQYYPDPDAGSAHRLRRAWLSFWLPQACSQGPSVCGGASWATASWPSNTYRPILLNTSSTHEYRNHLSRERTNNNYA